MKKTLAGKKALVTGASSGIGKSIALAFAEEGADVFISYHKNESGAQQTVSQIGALGRTSQAFCMDISDVQSLSVLVEKAIQFLGSIDILVNNAGTVTRHTHFLDIPVDALDKIMAVNLRAPFRLSQLVAQHMIQQKIAGSIINISSISAQVISPGLTHYECSKAGMHMLTRASANALAKDRIRVNGIAPGLIATNINRVQRETDPQLWASRVSTIPLGKTGTAEDVARIAVLLASDQSDWMTGSMINVDGGQCVR